MLLVLEPKVVPLLVLEGRLAQRLAPLLGLPVPVPVLLPTLVVQVPAGLLGLLAPLLEVARQGQQVAQGQQVESKLRLVRQVAFRQVAFQESQHRWLLELPYNP
jgi:hypothetical protein